VRTWAGAGVNDRRTVAIYPAPQPAEPAVAASTEGNTVKI